MQRSTLLHTVAVTVNLSRISTENNLVYFIFGSNESSSVMREGAPKTMKHDSKEPFIVKSFLFLKWRPFEKLVRAIWHTSSSQLVPAFWFDLATSTNIFLWLTLLERWFGFNESYFSEHRSCVCPLLLPKLHPAGPSDSWALRMTRAGSV